MHQRIEQARNAVTLGPKISPIGPLAQAYRLYGPVRDVTPEMMANAMGYKLPGSWPRVERGQRNASRGPFETAANQHLPGLLAYAREQYPGAAYDRLFHRVRGRSPESVTEAPGSASAVPTPVEEEAQRIRLAAEEAAARAEAEAEAVGEVVGPATAPAAVVQRPTLSDADFDTAVADALGAEPLCLDTVGVEVPVSTEEESAIQPQALAPLEEAALAPVALNGKLREVSRTPEPFLGGTLIDVVLGSDGKRYILAKDVAERVLGIGWPNQFKWLNRNHPDFVATMETKSPGMGSPQRTVIEVGLAPTWLVAIDLGIVAEDRREEVKRLKTELAEALKNYVTKGAAVNPRATEAQQDATIAEQRARNAPASALTLPQVDAVNALFDARFQAEVPPMVRALVQAEVNPQFDDLRQVIRESNAATQATLVEVLRGLGGAVGAVQARIPQPVAPSANVDPEQGTANAFARQDYASAEEIVAAYHQSLPKDSRQQLPVSTAEAMMTQILGRMGAIDDPAYGVWVQAENGNHEPLPGLERWLTRRALLNETSRYLAIYAAERETAKATHRAWNDRAEDMLLRQVTRIGNGTVLVLLRKRPLRVVQGLPLADAHRPAGVAGVEGRRFSEGEATAHAKLAPEARHLVGQPLGVVDAGKAVAEAPLSPEEPGTCAVPGLLLGPLSPLLPAHRLPCQAPVRLGVGMGRGDEGHARPPSSQGLRPGLQGRGHPFRPCTSSRPSCGAPLAPLSSRPPRPRASSGRRGRTRPWTSRPSARGPRGVWRAGRGRASHTSPCTRSRRRTARGLRRKPR